MIPRDLSAPSGRPVSRRRACAALLWLFLLLFLLRVLAQFIQFTVPLSWLPAFDRWQGSALSYPVLLAAQLAIVVLAAWTAWRCGRDRLRLRPRSGRLLIGVGGLYFLVMSVRLLVGLWLLPEHPWFGRPLPAFFHLVLAGYILTLGYCYRQQ